MDTTLIMQVFILVNAVVLGVVVTLAVQHGLAHRANKKRPTPVPQPQQAPEVVKFDPDTKRKILKDAEENFRAVLSKSVTSLENDLLNTTAKLHDQLERVGQDTESQEAEQYRQSVSDLQNKVKNILEVAQSAITEHQNDLTEKLNARQSELENDLIDKITELEQELVSRQAQLQAELNERQAELEARLAKHHAELRTGFNERQEKIEAELTRHQTELESSLKQREVSLAKVQTELDASLLQRKQELEAVLNDEMTKKRAFLASQLETKLNDAISSFLLQALPHNIDLGAQVPYITALLDEHKKELVEGVSGHEQQPSK